MRCFVSMRLRPTYNALFSSSTIGPSTMPNSPVASCWDAAGFVQATSARRAMTRGDISSDPNAIERDMLASHGDQEKDGLEEEDGLGTEEDDDRKGGCRWLTRQAVEAEDASGHVRLRSL